MNQATPNPFTVPTTTVVSHLAVATMLLLFTIPSISSANDSHLSRPTITESGSGTLEGLELQRLITELDYLIDETDRIRLRTGGSRIRFNYAALSADLLRVRNLVVEHLRILAAAPNTIAPKVEQQPVRGNYTRQQRQNTTLQ